MDEVRWLKSLESSRGASADAAGLDVAPGVMRAVRAIEASAEPADRLFPFAAAVALVAGAVAVASLIPGWFSTPPQSPLSGLTEAFNLVLQ